MSHVVTPEQYRNAQQRPQYKVTGDYAEPETLAVTPDENVSPVADFAFTRQPTEEEGGPAALPARNIGQPQPTTVPAMSLNDAEKEEVLLNGLQTQGPAMRLPTVAPEPVLEGVRAEKEEERDLREDDDKERAAKDRTHAANEAKHAKAVKNPSPANLNIEDATNPELHKAQLEGSRRAQRARSKAAKPAAKKAVAKAAKGTKVKAAKATPRGKHHR
jgi:hypothetical protein